MQIASYGHCVIILLNHLSIGTGILSGQRHLKWSSNRKMTKMKNFNHKGEKGAQRFYFQILLSPSFVRLIRLRGLFFLKFLVILRSFRIKKLNDAALEFSALLNTNTRKAIYFTIRHIFYSKRKLIDNRKKERK